jgi:hypothetical protein
MVLTLLRIAHSSHASDLPREFSRRFYPGAGEAVIHETSYALAGNHLQEEGSIDAGPDRLPDGVVAEPRRRPNRASQRQAELVGQRQLHRMSARQFRKSACSAVSAPST